MKHHVAAGDPATAQAARSLLEAGGNAFDAAVAAMFTAMVAEPTLTSAGGGGSLMAYPAQGVPMCFDFFVDMPSGQPEGPLDFEGVWADFGTTRQEFHVGLGAVAVPGNIAGLLHVHERLGCTSCRDVLAPAIQAAREGVPISSQQAYVIGILEPILTREPAAAALFASKGKMLGEGDKMRMPEFADFLDALADVGSNLFYHELAEQVTEPFREGGLLRASDLRGYTVHEREPLVVDYKKHTVLLNPPPAASGSLMAFTLALLDSVEEVDPETLVRAFAFTNAFREDPQPDWAGSFLAGEWPVAGRPEPVTRGSTTHVSVLDRDGNAASTTTTNGEGCGHLVTGCGFMLNNMLGEEDLSPDGFHRHVPGTRLATMMAPSIALRDGRPELVVGSGGSNRIRSAVLQVLVNRLAHGQSLAEAVDAPRLHLEGETLHAEPGATLAGNFEMEPWPEQNVFFGGAHSVAPGEAVGDTRRNGSTEVF
jgi:gamma-glutamyltranspeptidase/glutathione hydrolase